MSVLNTFQHKQCLCILTFPKRNAYFIGQFCIICKTKLSVDARTLKTLTSDLKS